MGSVWETARYSENFARRHIGPSEADKAAMLKTLGYSSLSDLIGTAVPKSILDQAGVTIDTAATEAQALAELRQKMAKNKIYKSFIGMGYSDCLTPGVIQRNILENPAWYTQYTPYQAEIAQGRLEALMNFQTMISDLTGFAMANSSLLDEGTAAAEAMNMCYSSKGADSSDIFLVAADCHPQTIEVVRTRAEPLGIQVKVAAPEAFDFAQKPFGILLQYPTTTGAVLDYRALIQKAHDHGALVTMAADLLSLVTLTSPGELGADVAVGNSQRFGVPMGFGGPHAAYIATRDEYKRKLPGRIVGVSKDSRGKNAYRLSLQTREQHIRRDKATSNICTAQVLLAIMSSMYAVYHGPEGLKKIAGRVNALATIFGKGVETLGLRLAHPHFFDTVTVAMDDQAAKDLIAAAEAKSINLRFVKGLGVSVAFDETSELADVETLLSLVGRRPLPFTLEKIASEAKTSFPAALARTSSFLTHPVFNSYHSETEMQRYIRMLEGRDLSLTRSMIPLGSCTMKLNAASELYPVTWAEVNKLHPFVPKNQAQGYAEMFQDLERWIAELTGFDAVSLQPNSGAQGEYAGLLVIRKYHIAKGAKNRTVCLIPSSAHGTNPASAALAGMKVVVVKCDSEGNIDIGDLQAKATAHAADLAALMITYPSTHGVFEEGIREICDLIHTNGGLVYMDGANLNAQIGLCKPGKYGPDVCHLNLHKTFCIPHGGGGPGMGPIAVKQALAPFLPNHPVVSMGGQQGVGPVSAAPWGSPSILPISWMYIRMMGGDGLKEATQTAILNANYIAKRLGTHYPIVYTGRGGLVAHECIIDLSGLKKSADIDVDDIAKRLIDYGFHAPTVSWPVPGSMMIEPTESESKAELDRFCDAMIAIRREIKDVEESRAPRAGNVLKNAPHTADTVTAQAWDYPYSRELAAFPASWVKQNKFWPFVSRIDNAYGDRNLVCTCPPLEDYE